MSERLVTHHKDVDYFNSFPAPLMELLHSTHYVDINATITFFGPMLYFLTRALWCRNVLEIGVSKGYSSYYLASAVFDNLVRYPGEGYAMYYGIDIEPLDDVKEKMDAKGLPHVLIQMDSMDLTPKTFEGVEFDLIFQDGNHDTDHVMYEIKTMWPQLKGNGNGWWVYHDCYGPAEDGFRRLIPFLKQGGMEWIRLDDHIYGMAIIRKMDGYDHNKKHWPD